jgi:hypothetical protein
MPELLPAIAETAAMACDLMSMYHKLYSLQEGKSMRISHALQPLIRVGVTKHDGNLLCCLYSKDPNVPIDFVKFRDDPSLNPIVLPSGTAMSMCFCLPIRIYGNLEAIAVKYNMAFMPDLICFMAHIVLMPIPLQKEKSRLRMST